jgi:glutamate 5-kinase
MPGQTVRQTIIRQARHIVVKVGTNAITDARGRLDLDALQRFCADLAAVMARGVNVTLVASGAVGAGIGELDLPGRPKTLPMLQAAAAVGQGQLMRTFHDLFAAHGRKVAQVLLTRSDFENRTRYLNIRNTLLALSEMGVLPILNENDAVATEELAFGDNDMIAAHVTNLLAADLLVLLSTVDGVLTADGAVLETIEQVDAEALSHVRQTRSALGSGGMGSKMTAANLVTQAGEAACIANARTPNVLSRLLDGETLGTVFVPAAQRLSSRRRWIGQIAKPVGRLVVDPGAVRAVAERGKSLLPSGIVRVEGGFDRGDAVSISAEDGREVARGLSNYSAEELLRIIGRQSAEIAGILGEQPYDEAVHRNNMAVL